MVNYTLPYLDPFHSAKPSPPRFEDSGSSGESDYTSVKPKIDDRYYPENLDDFRYPHPKPGPFTNFEEDVEEKKGHNKTIGLEEQLELVTPISLEAYSDHYCVNLLPGERSDSPDYLEANDLNVRAIELEDQLDLVTPSSLYSFSDSRYGSSKTTDAERPTSPIYAEEREQGYKGTGLQDELELMTPSSLRSFGRNAYPSVEHFDEDENTFPTTPLRGSPTQWDHVERAQSPAPSPSDLTFDHCTQSTETPPKTANASRAASPTTSADVTRPDVKPESVSAGPRPSSQPLEFKHREERPSNSEHIPVSAYRDIPATYDPCINAITLISAFVSAVSFQQSSLHAFNFNVTGQDHSAVYSDFASAILETKPRACLTRSAGKPGFYLADPMGDNGSELFHGDEAYCLEEIAKMIKTSAAHVAGNYCASTLRSTIIKSFVVRWKESVETCLSTIHNTTQSRIHNLLASYFGNRKGLHAELRRVTDEKIESCVRVTQERLQSTLQMEELGTTLNEEYLFWYKSRVKSLYESSAKAAFSEFGETRILQAMARDFAKYECALDFMAEVRAYFQVAYKRFTDQVCLIIENDFIRELHLGLGAVLIAALKPGSDNFRQVCEKLMREDIGLH